MGRVHRAYRAAFSRQATPSGIPAERSELRLRYEQDGLPLDLSAAGRGFQQTLLLLAYLYQDPRSVLLLDEPDAHLEIIRQRETYNLLNEVAAAQGSQVVAASHSEVVLNQAAERDVVVAFVGAPHRIDSRSAHQAAKALRSIRFDLYYLAERHGWMLFLEGSTDLAILRSLARKLGHPAAQLLDEPPIHYVKGNIPQHARDAFHGLREAKPDLVALALFDFLPTPPDSGQGLEITCWRRREIENYLVTPAVLERFAIHEQPDDLFGRAEAARRVELMRANLSPNLYAHCTPSVSRRHGRPKSRSRMIFWLLFKNYFERLGLPQLFRKRNYHALADLLDPAQLAPDARAEIEEKLANIRSTAAAAHPRT